VSKRCAAHKLVSEWKGRLQAAQAGDGDSRRFQRPQLTMVVYKIVAADEWREAEAAGVFVGAAIDRADGFIHFSTAEQAPETAAKWFAGREDLTLAAVDAEALGAGPVEILRRVAGDLVNQTVRVKDSAVGVQDHYPFGEAFKRSAIKRPWLDEEFWPEAACHLCFYNRIHGT
jgi:hypothetical protein